MKLCKTQRDAILKARSGRTTLWVKDHKEDLSQESRAQKESQDEDMRVGYVYSMDKEILKKIAIVIAPDNHDEPHIEERNGQGLLAPEMRMPCMMMICGTPLMLAMEFLES